MNSSTTQSSIFAPFECFTNEKLLDESVYALIQRYELVFSELHGLSHIPSCSSLHDAAQERESQLTEAEGGLRRELIGASTLTIEGFADKLRALVQPAGEWIGIEEDELRALLRAQSVEGQE